MKTEQHLVVQAFIERFREQKLMAEKAVGQVSDKQLHEPLDENTNCLTVIMKHMAGNLRSRFTEFLCSDGEKPDRDRDAEFVDDVPDRLSLMSIWEQGWNCLFESINALTDEDLGRRVTIRNQPHTVADALMRRLAHAAYHVGQIVQLSRFLAKDCWTTLTIPRGGSGEFTAKMREKFAK